MAADLGSTVLGSVLAFGRARLESLLQDVATDAGALLEALVPGTPPGTLTPATATAANGHLTAAEGHLNALTADLSPPPENLAAVRAAFAELSAAVSEVHAAIVVVGTAVPAVGSAEQALVSVVRKATVTGAVTFSGLVEQLGLHGPGAAVADGFSAAGQTIRYQLANAAERPVPGPPGALLTLQASTLTASLDYGAPTPTLGVSLDTGLAVGLGADGFVSALLGSSAAAQAAVKVNLDTTSGVTFGAGVHNRIELPGQLALPGVDLRALGLELPTDAPSALDLTGTLAGALGPLDVVVDGAGVRLAFAGNPPAASLDLRPPSGAGVALDVGLVNGGGFLSQHDGVYGGALDLDLGPVGIKAVGLLRPTPFSLVLVLSVPFHPPVQLSFGFTLNAVGGIVAIERALSVDALRAGVHDHTVDTVLFPDDPVAAAPSILPALASIFPEQHGGFVAGPLFELGWGSPVSFVRARLGVVLSAASDPTLVLLGSVRVALPLPEAAIVDLRAELEGEITPDHTLVLVSLEGSKVAGFALSGEFGLLIGYGDEPELAISAGGFHPGFSPPGELAGLRRVSVDISPPSIMSLRTEAYLALTSNSFQLGCRVELRAELAGVGAEGHLQFDAIVRFEPFRFEIDLSAGVSLYAFGHSFAGVDLHLHLEGPGPWSAHGTASISVLWWDVDFDLPTITWGSGAGAPVAPVSPQAIVRDALHDPAAWTARLPPGADGFVALRALDSDGDVVVHPLGAFEVRQKATPLETKLDRIGRSPVSEKRVNLGPPTVGGLPAAAVSNADDSFALGQYLEMTNDERLSHPAFEKRPAGLALNGATAQRHGSAAETPYQWETVYPKEELPRKPGLVKLTLGATAAALAVGAAGRAAVALGNPYAVAAAPVTLADPAEMRVLGVRDLAPIVGAPTAPLTKTLAAQAAAELVASDPSLAGTIQLVGAGAV